MLGYGIFCVSSHSVWVGWRGTVRKITGKHSTLISFSFVIGGVICIFSGLTYWLMSQELFEIILAIGLGIPFLGNLDGLIFGD